MTIFEQPLGTFEPAGQPLILKQSEILVLFGRHFKLSDIKNDIRLQVHQ